MRRWHLWGLPALFALGALVFAQGSAPAAPQQLTQSDEWDGLPAGPGREEVYGLCSACHSLMIVKQQGLSREAWDETLIWMIEEQGMPELEAESLDLVLDYLAAHYGPNRRKP